LYFTKPTYSFIVSNKSSTNTSELERAANTSLVEILGNFKGPLFHSQVSWVLVIDLWSSHYLDELVVILVRWKSQLRLCKEVKWPLQNHYTSTWD